MKNKIISLFLLGLVACKGGAGGAGAALSLGAGVGNTPADVACGANPTPDSGNCSQGVCSLLIDNELTIDNAPATGYTQGGILLGGSAVLNSTNLTFINTYLPWRGGDTDRTHLYTGDLFWPFDFVSPNDSGYVLPDNNELEIVISDRFDRTFVKTATLKYGVDNSDHIGHYVGANIVLSGINYTNPNGPINDNERNIRPRENADARTLNGWAPQPEYILVDRKVEHAGAAAKYARVGFKCRTVGKYYAATIYHNLDFDYWTVTQSSTGVVATVFNQRADNSYISSAYTAAFRAYTCELYSTLAGAPCTASKNGTDVPQVTCPDHNNIPAACFGKSAGNVELW